MGKIKLTGRYRFIKDDKGNTALSLVKMVMKPNDNKWISLLQIPHTNENGL